jgi:hypothetical protein
VTLETYDYLRIKEGAIVITNTFLLKVILFLDQPIRFKAKENNIKNT